MSEQGFRSTSALVVGGLMFWFLWNFMDWTDAYFAPLPPNRFLRVACLSLFAARVLATAFGFDRPATPDSGDANG